MALQDNGYIYKPDEQPFMAGSPASPIHTGKRQLAYVLIGLLLIFCAGLQNGLLTANMGAVRGELALDTMQGIWVQSAYLMGNAVMGMMWLKIRQHYSLQKFVRWTLILMFVSNVLQTFGGRFELELVARFIMGVGTSGLLTLGMFYAMQTFRAGKALIPLALSAGLMQAVSSLCYMMSPTLLADGNVTAMFVFQLAITLICLSAVLYLPLPKGYHEPALSWRDWLSFGLFSAGVACLCAYLSLGNVVWWTTTWLGFFLASGVLFLGLALWLEAYRDKPLINWHWISARQISFFLLMAMLTRLFTTEQSVGAGGVLALMGLSSEQLYGYYKLIFISSLFGLILSIITLNPKDVRRNTMIALLGIAVGAYLDIGVSSVTPVSHFYVSQSLIAFATFYFAGPVMLEGMVRAIAEGVEQIAGFVAVYSATQVFGGLLGNAIFGAFVQIQTQAHLQNLLAQITLDDGTITTANYAQAVQMVNLEARILAYNDLFFWVWVFASLGFVVSFVFWAYRRYHQIDVLEVEMQKLQAYLADPNRGRR
ncbi:MFS transporter [Moraxella bovis]|uniref:MFS transporter n=1 Tax=Moraxella bovis TaxID=476 RepID=UPI0022274E71|nr:MFS transporter [Moraxella bovis]UYZ68626.1 MFS transporter [Moraxella bovis]UYZ70998.1 MFS transporter [Moraxella bovis]UYZ73080.1 MFS transporter [Moraxella bovis]UYZ89632.1 MFS transporter [Moraxella bovis]UZA14299.1 MFS transporter [Moraxella bovis]